MPLKHIEKLRRVSVNDTLTPIGKYYVMDYIYFKEDGMLHTAQTITFVILQHRELVLSERL